MLYCLYEFDQKLRHIVFCLIESIEIRLRAAIAYYLGVTYGPEGYMDKNNFELITRKNGKEVHTIIIEKFKKECQRQKLVPFVKHHLEKYGGTFLFGLLLNYLLSGILCLFIAF